MNSGMSYQIYMQEIDKAPTNTLLRPKSSELCALVRLKEKINIE